MLVLNCDRTLHDSGEKYIIGLKERNRLQNIDFLCTLVNKGKIMGVRDVSCFRERITQVKNSLDKKYGNNWDFDLEYTGFLPIFKLWVSVLYSKITITNSKNENHEIKDLLVSFRINNDDKIYPWSFCGSRLSITQEEYESGYVHSHLPCVDYNSCISYPMPRMFCTGDGEIRELSTRLKFNFNSELFELFLEMLDSFVSWESIEGGPHYRMNDITRNSLSTPCSYSSFAYSKIRSQISTLPFDFKMKGGRYSIIINDKFKNFCENILIPESSDYPEVLRLFVSKKGRNYFRYLSPGKERDRTIDVNFQKGFIIIKGEKKQCKVINSIKTDLEQDLKNYNLHPEFLKAVALNLEKEIYEKSIKNGLLRRQN